MHNTAHYFKKHQIDPKDILYIYRRNHRTVICLDSKEELVSSIPVQDMAALLPKDEFIPIIQGTLVNRDRIVNISHEGVYTMSDGKTFQGRKRYMSVHRKLRKTLFPESLHNSSEAFVPPLGFYEKCSILDHMPIAYCVIELVFDENGHGIDFIFRYCNQHMEVVEGVPKEEMLDHSFYEVFKNGDKKWLVAYADVALNGSTRTIHDYSPEIDKHLTIHCYQPEAGFCACVLVPDEG